jgi:DNA polymerase-3 subunit epsilon
MGLFDYYQRIKWGKIARSTPLAELYSSPSVSLNEKVQDIDWLVVDCEMTGLDPAKNSLLSIGWVSIRQGEIDYASRRHILLHSQDNVGDSAIIHGLLDRQIAGASSASKALSVLSAELANSVAVFHHAHLDVAFLQRASMTVFRCPVRFQYVDTLAIEKRRLDRQGKLGRLQLAACRERYGLPAALEHNAMTDAIATAELFLAQLAYAQNKTLCLRDLNARSTASLGG